MRKNRTLVIAGITCEVAYDSSLRLSRRFDIFSNENAKNKNEVINISIDITNALIKDKGELVGKFDNNEYYETHVYRGRNGYLIQSTDLEFIRYQIWIESPEKFTILINSGCNRLTYIANEAISICMPYAFVFAKSLMIHASCVTYKGKAYLFVGKSGRGKSTHSRMWLENLEGVELINDDCPAISIREGNCIVYGTPWSGKTRCYKNVSAPLGGIVQIHQSKENMIERASTLRAMAIIMPCIVGDMKWDVQQHGNIVGIAERIASEIPVYDLQCTPTAEAAILCSSVITIQAVEHE